jgi:predicted nucleic acid-binding protein
VKYGFSNWDSLILAAALEHSCTCLYSEDLHHGQIIEGCLTIINPFTSP